MRAELCCEQTAQATSWTSCWCLEKKSKHTNNLCLCKLFC
jgi:hypothetical protein